jgi:hypothetical protein
MNTLHKLSKVIKINTIGLIAIYNVDRYFNNFCQANDTSSDSDKISAHQTKVNQTVNKVSVLSNNKSTYIEVLMKEKITTKVADSISESQQVANELAKSLVIEVLHNPKNLHQLGIILHNCFNYPQVQLSIRDLVFYHLHTEYTIKNTIYLLHGQIKYFLSDAGKNYTLSQLLTLLQWYSTQDYFFEMVIPLFIWSISSKDASVDHTVDYLAKAASDSLSYNQVSTYLHKRCYMPIT